MYQFPTLIAVQGSVAGVSRGHAHWKNNEILLKSMNDWEHNLCPEEEFDKALFELHCLEYLDTDDNRHFTMSDAGREAYESWRTSR